MATAGILIIGDEILHGEIRDENSPWIIEQLTRRGVAVREVNVVPDERKLIVDRLQRLRQYDHVLVTGGIGPTHDDLTRQAVADALGQPLTEHPTVMRILQEKFGEDLNPARQEMATLPEGCEAAHLPGTPGIAFRAENVYVLPGIPSLMKELFLFWEDRFTGEPLSSRTLVVRGREGEIAGPLGQLQDRFPTVQLGSYPHDDGTITLKVRGNKDERVEQAFERLKSLFPHSSREES